MPLRSWVIALFCVTACSPAIWAQPLEAKVQQINASMAEFNRQIEDLRTQLESVKFEMIQRDLTAIGLPTVLPGSKIVRHSAMALEYAEAYEQARWVAHIITPDILSGQVTRSNDFREDFDIETGSSVEADYFLKYLQSDSTYKYDAFGFDRGHLAPSADFRWSPKALSESYLYSNMSPQRAEFNRGAWGDLEDQIRGYLFRHPTTQLYVVTGPVLKAGLPVVERGVNKVSIPEYYFKVVADMKNQKGIGFLMPNREITYPLATFSAPINYIESQTGLDFFANLPDAQEELLESQRVNSDWLPDIAAGDVTPLSPVKLPPNHFNTVQVKNLVGNPKECWVCGTVVSSRLSRAGNVLLNLDKKFPNQVFTVMIKKEFVPNFPYNPEIALNGKSICAKGRVIELDGTPMMFVESEKAVEER